MTAAIPGGRAPDIVGYGKIKSLRNEYAHGLWTTDLQTKQTYLARFPEHGDWMPGESKPEPLEALQALCARIGELKVRIWKEVEPLNVQLLQQQIKHAQLAAEHQAARQQRRAAKAAQPQPAPSPPTEEEAGSEG